MRIGIVVHDQVHRLDVPLGRHREVALDDDRNDPAILGHEWHVERDVAAADGPVAEELLQDPGDRFVGDLGIAGAAPHPLERGQPLAPEQRGGAQQAGPGQGATAEERAASQMVGGHARKLSRSSAQVKAARGLQRVSCNLCRLRPVASLNRSFTR